VHSIDPRSEDRRLHKLREGLQFYAAGVCPGCEEINTKSVVGFVLNQFMMAR